METISHEEVNHDSQDFWRYPALRFHPVFTLQATPKNDRFYNSYRMLKMYKMLELRQ